jgi:glycine/serine hydroxymethyltransferase
MVLTDDEAIAKKINSACSRAAGRAADARHRRQGGGVRRGAAAEFKTYAQAVIANARGARPTGFSSRGAALVAGAPTPTWRWST